MRLSAAGQKAACGILEFLQPSAAYGFLKETEKRKRKKENAKYFMPSMPCTPSNKPKLKLATGTALSRSPPLHGIVVVEELNVAGPQFVAPHKVRVAGRSLVFVVTSQHALNAHTHTLDALDGAPARLSEEVEADDAVGVDMGMHRDWAILLLVKCDLGWLCGERTNRSSVRSKTLTFDKGWLGRAASTKESSPVAG